MAASFDPKTLLPDIKDILAHADLNSVSAKSVRKELAVRHPTVDIRAHKAAIDELTLQCFSAQDPNGADQEEEEAEEEDEVKPVAAKNGNYGGGGGAAAASSPARPLHASTSSKPPVKKAVAETDEEMARRLQAELDGSATPRRTRGGGASTSTTKKRKKVKSAATLSDGEDTGTKKKRKVSNTGFNKPWALSTELADVCGAPVLSRPQVTKKLWEYIKGHDLQNPSKRVEILTDDKLKRIFNGQSKVSSFGMAKFIGKHLYEVDPADLPAEMKSQDIIDSDDESD